MFDVGPPSWRKKPCADRIPMHGKSLSRPDNWSGEVSQAGEGNRPDVSLTLGNI